jgi:hypothetical protein
LLPILPAADVEEVVGGEVERRADAHRLDVELVAARGGAALEDRDVAAVGVDVQVLRIQMADADDHGCPSLSQ